MRDRCAGHCCRKFWLPHDPEELGLWRDAQQSTLLKDDANMIFEMVTYIGPAIPGDNFEEKISGKVAKQGHFYTCKTLDTETGNCKAYETRPQSLCGDYPYGYKCQYVGCTWDEAKQPQELIQLGVTP